MKAVLAQDKDGILCMLIFPGKLFDIAGDDKDEKLALKVLCSLLGKKDGFMYLYEEQSCLHYRFMIMLIVICT